MHLDIYQVDAFTDKLFGGNPAAVCPLLSWLGDEVMQNIAMENNLAETAFFVSQGEDYHLRWFTPTVEVDLCGHATLATAHVLFEHLEFQKDKVFFHTRSGVLIVQRLEKGKYLMDFPSDHAEKVEDPSLQSFLETALKTNVLELWKGKDDFLVVIETEKELRKLQPDFRALSTITSRGVVVTSRGNGVDFVSRGFFPQSGIDEDPATGSAHTLLTPYWSPRLKTNRMKAQQLSRRVGHFECIYKGERTALIGSAVSYLQGKINI